MPRAQNPAPHYLLAAAAILLASCSPPEEPDGTLAVGNAPTAMEETGALTLPPPVFGGDSDESNGPVEEPVGNNAPDAPPAARLTVLFSAAYRGEIEPCGCPGGPAGGMARRVRHHSEISALLGETIVVAEGPGLLFRQEVRSEAEEGLEATARAGLTMRLAARAGARFFVPGREDLGRIEPEELRGLANEAGLPLLAANLASDDGTPLFEVSQVVRVDANVVVLTGLSGWTPEPLSGLQRRTSEASLRDAANSAEQHDLMVVLTDLAGPELEQARLLAPPRTIFLRGGTTHTTPPDLDEPGPSLQIPPLGRELGRLDVFFTGAEGCLANHRHLQFASTNWVRRSAEWLRVGWAPARGEEDAHRLREQSRERIEGQLQELRTVLAEGSSRCHQVRGSAEPIAAGIIPDEATTNEVEGFRASYVSERVGNWQADRTRAQGAREAARPYRGVDYCLTCHRERYVGWTNGPHAGAWAQLVQAEATGNSECLPCHTTGFTMEDGVAVAGASVARSLLNVQCEACHGPGGGHPESGENEMMRMPAAADCLVCHDQANDPDFDVASAFEEACPTAVPAAP